MSAVFVWRDRHGVVHHLTSGESLIAERAALEAELAALAPAFEHGSAAERDAAGLRPCRCSIGMTS